MLCLLSQRTKLRPVSRHRMASRLRLGVTRFIECPFFILDSGSGKQKPKTILHTTTYHIFTSTALRYSFSMGMAACLLSCSYVQAT
jgi:hypothetical protein